MPKSTSTIPPLAASLGEKPVRIVGLIGGPSRNKRKIDNKRQVV
jgi:hypothetical protein